MKHRNFVTACFLTTCLLPGIWAPAAQAQDGRMPSDVLHEVVVSRLQMVAATPTEVEASTRHLLADVRTTGLTPEEEVALALVYFFTFDGLSAKPLFEKHMDRSDSMGRVSWQSLQQMSFMGARDYALVERRLAEFRQKFRPVPEDWEYTRNMVNNLARLAASQGDHRRAVDLVLEEVRSLPLETPFRSFELLATHYPSFRAVGETDSAIAWMIRHREALLTAAASDPNARDGSGEASPEERAAALRVAHRPGVMHYFPFADWLAPDSPTETTAQLVRRRRAIALKKLEGWIAAAHAGAETLQ